MLVLTSTKEKPGGDLGVAGDHQHLAVLDVMSLYDRMLFKFGCKILVTVIMCLCDIGWTEDS